MKKSRIKKFLVTSIYILFIILFVFLIISKKCQNDLFFDLKTGESILKHGIDFKDHFSFIPNLTYLYHHYLYDLIIYFIFKFFSYGGVFLFFFLIFILLGISIFYVNLKIGKSKIYALFITLVTSLIMGTFMTNRVQSVTFLLFYLEFYFLNCLYETGKKKYAIYLIILSIIIANIHMPLWIFTIVLTLPFIAEYLLSKVKSLKPFLNNRIVINKVKNEKLWLITIALLIFCGLLTPLKFSPYTFFIKALKSNSDFLFISEMMKTVFIDYQYFLFLFCLTFLLIIMLKVKIKIRDLCLFLGLFLFATLANRNIAYAYLFYPTLIYKILRENFDLTKVFSYLKKYEINNLGYLFMVIILIGVFLKCFIDFDIVNFNYKIKEDYPVESVKYIKENLDYKNIKLFNEFNFGSYLLYNDIPVFIDSRAEVYIKNFNGGYDIVNDYLQTEDYDKYQEIFEKYNFDYALIFNGGKLYNYLIKDSNYKPIYYESNKYVLFKCNL